MASCPDRNYTFGGVSLHGDKWEFKGAYRPLYDRFYEEEMKLIEAVGLEALQNEGAVQ